MAKGFTVKVEGLKEVEKALSELPKATGRNVMRRVAVERLKPMAEDAQSRARGIQWSGDLAESITVSTQLAGYARRLNRRSKSEAEAHMGPAGRGKAAPPQGSLQEFGTKNHPPQPFMRPAWDAHKNGLLPGLADDLWAEIKKATDRIARKASRKAR